jgi:pimeloyl-ACP methyl ester carboxylesterase
MPRVTANGMQIAYDAFGDESNRPLLLIMGLGAQMIAWDDAFCEQIAERAFHVVRFDNRDAGLSTHLHDTPPPDLGAAMRGDFSSASYTLSDMAADASGLLGALGIRAAHIVGASMGGMIAQTFAIEHPDQTLSLCSIMSTTGDWSVGQPTPDAMAVLLRAPPQTPEEVADNAVEAFRVIGGKGFPLDEQRVRRLAVTSWNRNRDPLGVTRQLLAILASGDRTTRLAGVKAPTVVIHGLDDTLVTPSGGEATARAIRGAELVTIEGMGHDLPVAVWDQIVDAIVENAGRAGARSDGSAWSPRG